MKVSQTGVAKKTNEAEDEVGSRTRTRSEVFAFTIRMCCIQLNCGQVNMCLYMYLNVSWPLDNTLLWAKKKGRCIHFQVSTWTEF